MIFSVTERSEFKRCRRKWDYGSYNRQSLGPIVAKRALSLGSLVHRAHADWTISPHLQLVDIFKAHSILALDNAKASYLAQVGAPISDIELDPLYDAIGLGLSMMANYQERWGSPLPEDFRIVAPEQPIVVPVPNTPHFLSGTLDGLIQDSRGRLYILERKTYGSRPNIAVLAHNDQFLAYIWILHQLRIGEVGGIAYDGMWKREKPPRGSTMPDLFLRVLLDRPEDEIQEFETHLTQEVTEMASNPPLYINRRWEGCWDCDFEKLCSATSRGEDADYIRNQFYTQRFREVREEASAETDAEPVA